MFNLYQQVKFGSNPHQEAQESQEKVTHESDVITDKLGILQAKYDDLLVQYECVKMDFVQKVKASGSDDKYILEDTSLLQLPIIMEDDELRNKIDCSRKQERNTFAWKMDEFEETVKLQ